MVTSLPCGTEKESQRSLNFFTALGDSYGAGIAGKGFAIALSNRVDLRLSIATPTDFELAQQIDSPGEVALLRALVAKPVSIKFPSFVRGSIATLRWSCPNDWPRRITCQSPCDKSRAAFVSHIFFEYEHLTRREIDWLGESDVVTSGSDWASQILADHGMKNVATVHQGVELETFRPLKFPTIRVPEFDGKFLVFSGGKFEHRKGTDLVIAAFSRFREQHRDAVLLINAYNPWPLTQSGLAYSPHFHFSPVHKYPSDFEKLLIDNGIPSESFQVLCPSSRKELATVMASSDCGLFPVRCEGGTNHFLMEYMACGRPIIATYTTGLMDILRPDQNCIGLQSFQSIPVTLLKPQPERGNWNEPTIDEIVAALERLYLSRELGDQLVHAGLLDIQRFAWPQCADHLLDVIHCVATLSS